MNEGVRSCPPEPEHGRLQKVQSYAAPKAALTQARVGSPFAQAGGFHQEHAGLVRHPRAENQEQGPQHDATLEGERRRDADKVKLPHCLYLTPNTVYPWLSNPPRPPPPHWGDHFPRCGATHFAQGPKVCPGVVMDS